VNLLIADDESPKLESIAEFLAATFPGANMERTRSVRSTLSRVRSGGLTAVVLDMSLPTFDVGPGEKGGRAQNLGGEEVLRYMEFYDVTCPVVIVTQYGYFSEGGKHVALSKVEARLRLEHSTNFKAMIHYSGSTSPAWRAALKESIEGIFGEAVNC
jgi:hypothetical protein